MPTERARTALVTDAGRGSAITIIRSLGRGGWRVIAADDDPRSIGFRSRYAQETLLYPPPSSEPEAFFDAVLDAARRRNVDLIVPVTDNAILPLSEGRDEFEPCVVAVPSLSALDVVRNKLATVELAERLGVPTPRTEVVTTANAASEAAATFNWPIVLKPQTSAKMVKEEGIASFKVSYANNPAELRERMRQLEGRSSVLLQEYVVGEGVGVELLTFEGRPLAAFQHRRLREVPINGGASSFRESVPLDSQLFEYARALLQEIRWTGLAMVEFRVTPESAYLMEINGRVWGSLPLAVHSGMDFPSRMASLYSAGPPENGRHPDTNYRAGIRSRNLELDLLWMASVLFGRRRYSFLPNPKRSQALSALFGLLSPRSRLDIMSMEDPLPGLAEVAKIVRKFHGKLMKPSSQT